MRNLAECPQRGGILGLKCCFEKEKKKLASTLKFSKSTNLVSFVCEAKLFQHESLWKQIREAKAATEMKLFTKSVLLSPHPLVFYLLKLYFFFFFKVKIHFQ